MSKEITKEMIKESGDCIVKFTAPWCGACKTVGVMLEKVLSGSPIKLYTCDISESTLPQVYGVNSLPTIIRFKDGEVVGRTVGSASVDKIKRDLNL